jgi:D-threo-aldose 1-dehydrogenase
MIENVPFGRGGIEMSQLVFGGSVLGGMFRPVSDDAAQDALAAAWEGGIRAFDTAPHYGVGQSESRMGRFFADKPRDEYVLSTKVGRLLVDTDEDVEGVDEFYGTPRRKRVRDYSRDGVLRSLESSLERLGVDRIDIVYIHDPEDHMDQALGEAAPALSELRDQGVIRSFGAGMNFTAPLERFARETDADTLMLAGRYSLLDMCAAESLLPACEQCGVSVIAAGVFNSGILANPVPGAHYEYAPASEELIARAVRVRDVCERHGVSVRAAAMAFVLRNPAVQAVAVGARSREQIEGNIAEFGANIPDALWPELEAVPSAQL